MRVGVVISRVSSSNDFVQYLGRFTQKYFINGYLVNLNRDETIFSWKATICSFPCMMIWTGAGLSSRSVYDSRVGWYDFAIRSKLMR